MRRRGISLVELLAALAIIGVMILLILPAVLAGHEAARSIQCQNSQKQIVLGLMNYHHDHQAFPPAYTREQGRLRGVSWGIQMLPYFEHPVLFRLIDRDADIGAAENRTARVTSIRAFLCTSDVGRMATMPVEGPPGVKGSVEVARASFVGSFGTGDPLDPAPGDGMFMRDRSVRIEDVLDGTSTTFLLGERRHQAGPTAWAGPIGPRGPAMILGSTMGDPGPNQKPPRAEGYSSMHPGGVYFGYVDGSVRFVTDSVGANVYGALATRRGGELIGDFER